jgi:tetratricopeptide (TPR) repeat protein
MCEPKTTCSLFYVILKQTISMHTYKLYVMYTNLSYICFVTSYYINFYKLSEIGFFFFLFCYRPNLENLTTLTETLPECIPLDFSLHLFEHLQSMRYRGNLSMEPELKLSQSNMTYYGCQIAASLNKNQSSWQLYNLATEFWRAKGDAPRAIECVRWALHRSPAPVRHIALVHLGNILHQARRSAEAAIVLHAAIDHAPRDPISHWTLGNVYTVLGDYTRAVACLDNAIQLDPSLKDVRRTRHSVLCHSKVGQALSELKDTLQGLLHDLEHCQDMRQQRLRLQQMIHREKNHPFNSMLGEHVRAELDASMLRLDNSLQHLLSAVQSMVHQLNVPKKKQTDESSQSSNLSAQSSKATMEWPSTEECQTLSRHSVNVALLFIPPENKGYE